MVKKNTHEHDYFKNLKDFLTYHFNKTPGNETKLANVLEYCTQIYVGVSVSNSYMHILLDTIYISVHATYIFLNTSYGTISGTTI